MEKGEKLEGLIKKLLALSKSSNENEAASALGKAQELLEKYNMSMDEIKLSDDTDNGPEMTKDDFELDGKRWKTSLIHYVALNNLCRSIRINNYLVYVVGRPPNVAAVREMSYWVIGQLERIAFEETPRAHGVIIDPVTMQFKQVSNESKKRWKAAFFDGAIDRIKERLKEGRKERVMNDPNTKALVINREQETMGFYNAMFPYRYSTSRPRDTRSLGYAAGRKAGDKVSIIGPSRHVNSGVLRLKKG